MARLTPHPPGCQYFCNDSDLTYRIPPGTPSSAFPCRLAGRLSSVGESLRRRPLPLILRPRQRAGEHELQAEGVQAGEFGICLVASHLHMPPVDVDQFFKAGLPSLRLFPA